MRWCFIFLLALSQGSLGVNKTFLHHGHCKISPTNRTEINDCSIPNLLRSTRSTNPEKKETRATVDFHHLSIETADELSDVRILKRSGTTTLHVCARLGRYLVGFKWGNETWEEQWRRQIFNGNRNLEKYPWVTADPTGDGNDIIIIRTESGLNFFRPNEGFTSLEIIAETQASYGDFYEWLSDSSTILLGNFYPDGKRTGIFTKKWGEVEFLAVAEDLNDDPPLEAVDEDVDLDDFWRSNSTKFFLHSVSKEGPIFILLNNETLKFYKFNDDYKSLQETLTTDLVLSSGYGKVTLMFAELTKQPMKDLILHNDLGLFLYQYNKTYNNYTIVDVDTRFSKSNRWQPSYTDTLRVLSLDGYDYLSFSGPKGFEILRFDPQTTSWADTFQGKPTYPAFLASTGNTLFTQTAEGVIQWGRVKLHEEIKPVIPDLETDEPDFFNYGNSSRETTAKLIRKQPLPVKPTLRYSERWPGNFAYESVNPAQGNVEFGLPLVNITLSPMLNLEISAYYDSLRDSSTILGTGWGTTIMEDFITVDYQRSIYPGDHKYYLSIKGQVHSVNILSISGDVVKFNFSSLEYDKNLNMWTYETQNQIRTYGKCGDIEAMHWSLGWKTWRGPGSDLSSLTPLPITWYLCEIVDKPSGTSITYTYHTDSEKIFDDKVITTNIRLKSINALDVSVNFKYAQKSSKEYVKNSPYDKSTGLYFFPTPLEEKYVLEEIHTNSDLFVQRLVFRYKTIGGKSVFTDLNQIIGEREKTAVAFDYEKIGKSLVMTKSMTNLVVEFKYELFKDPVIYEPVSEFPLYPNSKMSVYNDYSVKAYPNYLNNEEIILEVMNQMGTHTTSLLKATAPSNVTSFDVRTSKFHIIAVLFTDNNTVMHIWDRLNDTWTSTPPKSFKKKAIISTNEDVLVISDKEAGGTEVFEWNVNTQKWEKNELENPAFTRINIDKNRVIGVKDNELWIYQKNLTSVQWQVKTLPLGEFTLTGCEILENFNYTKGNRTLLCEMMEQRDLQVTKNIIYLSRIRLSGDILSLSALLITLDEDNNIADAQEKEIISQNILEMKQTAEIPVTLENPKTGTIHLGNVRQSGKIIMQVTDVTGDFVEDLREKEIKKHIKEFNEQNEDYSTLSLVQWGNYSAVLGAQGVYLMDQNMYKITGSDWVKGPIAQVNYVHLGKTLMLKSPDDGNFTLVKGEEILKTFELWKAGQMLNRYPEYIAYHNSDTTFTVLTFEDEDTLGETHVFTNEQLLFSSGHHAILSLVNNTGSMLTTRENLKVRPVSSLQHKRPKPNVILMKSYDSTKLERTTGYRRSYETDQKNLIIKQTVEIIPAGDKSISGWMAQENTYDLLKKTSKEKSRAFDNEGKEVDIPPRKTRKTITGEPPDGTKEMLFDKSGHWVISNFYPYELNDDEADYIGFESYEKPRNWSFSQEDVIKNQFSFTGNNFLRLEKNNLTRKFIPKQQSEIYLASTWVRTSQHLQVGKSTSILSARILTTGGIEMLKLRGETLREIGAWSYLELRLDFSVLHEIYLSYLETHMDQVHKLPSPAVVKFIAILTITPENGVVDVDHVRFSPFAHEFSATVYDVRREAVTEVITNNGLVTRTIYNQFGQRVTSMAENGEVEELVSGSVNAAETPDELKPHPKSEITITPQEGFVENFDELSFVKRWKTDSVWFTAPYQLWHSEEKPHTFQANEKLLNPASTALYFEYSLGSKTSLKLQWGEDTLLLSRDTATALLGDLQVPLSGSLIIFRDEARLVAFVEGALVLDKVKTLKSPWDKFLVEMTGNVVIQNLVIMKQPRIEIQYHNAWDDVIQIVRREDTENAIVIETLYDDLGRGAITTTSTRVTPKSNYFGYRKSFVSNANPAEEDSVWKTGKLKGEADVLNPKEEGFAYTRTIYYKNPLNQKKVVGLAGREFSTEGPFKKQYKLDSGIEHLAILFPRSLGYRQETEVEPNESSHVSIFDKENNEVAKYVHVLGYDPILTTYEYDSEKRLTKILPPLYHEKANTSTKTEIWTPGENLTEELRELQKAYGTFFHFDEEGNLIKKITPDTGVEEYIYKDGHIRFLFQMKGNLTEHVTYYEYDAQGQMIGTGRITVPMTREDLWKNIDKYYIPGKETHQQTQFYDSHPDPDLRGRTQLIVTRIGNGSVLDRVTYNEDREVVTKTTLPVTDWSDFGALTSVNKTFINKKLRSLEYPYVLEGKPLRLFHEYNAVGQLVSLGTLNKVFVTFSYYGSGFIATEKFEEFSRKYGYDSPGYILTIEDPFLHQEATYTSGGYGQGGFGDGVIMRTTYKPHWMKESDERPFLIKKDMLNFTSAEMCLTFIKEKGYLAPNGRVLKIFLPNEVTDLPILCSGAVGYSIAKLTAEMEKPQQYGHCFAYGNHQELVKAKYYSDTDCTRPLQPHSFAKATEESEKIFRDLSNSNFIKIDQTKYQTSSVVGTLGKPFTKTDEVEKLLREFGAAESEPTANLFTFPINKLVMARVAENRGISEKDFLDHIANWNISLIKNNTNESFARKLYEKLSSEKLIPVNTEITQCLNEEFLSILSKNNAPVIPIVEVLHKHHIQTLGSSPFDVTSYDIDANGNHRQFKTGFVYYTIDYYKATNKVEKIRKKSIFTEQDELDFTVEHDSKGNVIQAMHKNIIDINYHPVSQRTQSITMADGTRILFFYDAKGERILKQVFGKANILLHETYYLRDDEGRVLMDRRVNYNTPPIAPDSVTTAYIYGPRGLIAFIRNDKFYSVTTDQVGSVKLIIHKNQVVAAYDYLPYGELMRIYGDEHIMYRYTGQEYDPETGLYNYHARLYDPSIGRFYQIDPQAQYPSPYKYSGNSPVSFFDPDGEFVFITTVIVLAIVGAYLGGAAANGTWNIAKWKWDKRTFIGILAGAVTGALLPFGFAGSMAFLASLGVGLIGSVLGTAVLGIGGAYLMAAANQGVDPTQWKWSEPEIWNEMFGGFATGSGILGSIRGVQKFGSKAAEWAGKSSISFVTKFARAAKPIAVGTSYLLGALTAYYSMTVANNNNPAFWKWDFSNPETWSALVDGFDSGMGLAENFSFISGKISKAIKKRKSFKLIFKNFSPAKLKSWASSLKKADSPFYKLVMAGLTGYLMGSKANDDFTNWDWNSFATYQQLFNGIFQGKDLVESLAEGPAKSSKKRQKLSALIKAKAKSLAASARKLISNALRSAYASLQRGLNFSRRSANLLARFATRITQRTRNFFRELVFRKGFDLREIGNKRARAEREAFGDIELTRISRIEEETDFQLRRSRELDLDEDVPFLSCKTRRKRALGEGALCSPMLPPISEETSETFLKKQTNKDIIEMVLDKTPKAHSSNNMYFYSEYLLGGISTHLLMKDNVKSMHVQRRERLVKIKRREVPVEVDQTLVLVNKPKIDYVKVVIKKFFQYRDDTGSAENAKTNWQNGKIVDIGKLKTILEENGINDFSKADIRAELVVLRVSKPEYTNIGQVKHLVEFNDGKEFRFNDLKDLPVTEEFSKMYDTNNIDTTAIDQATENIREFVALNDASEKNYDELKQYVEGFTKNFLEIYEKRQESTGTLDKKPLEAEFHAFLYGAIEMNFKGRGADVLVENVAGRGELDMLLFFHQVSEMTTNWQSVPIIFELKSKGKTPEATPEPLKDFEDFPHLIVEETPTELTARYPIDTKSGQEQIYRSGYFFNTPMRTLADRGIGVSVDSHSKDVRAEVIKIPKYNGIAETLVSGVSNRKILDQLVKQYYSFSPYANKKSSNSYMSRMALGEIMSRTESYVVSQGAKKAEVIFLKTDENWATLQVTHEDRKISDDPVEIPEILDPKEIKQYRVTMNGDLSDKGSIELYAGPLINNFKKSIGLAKISPISLTPLIDAAHVPRGNSPIKHLLNEFQNRLKKLPNDSFQKESDVQAILHGVLIGNKPAFEAAEKMIRVFPESSLSPMGRMDLVVQVLDISDTSNVKDNYFNVIEMKYEKILSNEGSKEPKPGASMERAIDQVMKYFERQYLEAITSQKVVEGTAVVVTNRGDVFYTIMEVTIDKVKTHFKLIDTNLNTDASDKLERVTTTKNRRSINQAPEKLAKSISQKSPHSLNIQWKQRRLLEWYTTSSASRAEFWGVRFIKSLLSTISLMMNTSYQVLPKRIINKISHQQEHQPGGHFSVLEMGDQWLAETNFQGNMLWLMILAKKFTGVTPYIEKPYHREYMREFDILARELTYEFAETLEKEALKCGINCVVRRVVLGVDFVTVSKNVYRNLVLGDWEKVTETLVKEILLVNSRKIAKMSSEKQAKKLLGLYGVGFQA